MGEAIVVTSGKGGVGKTTTAANLGRELASRGKKTVLVDADMGLRNLDIVMGLENRIVYNMLDVVQGKCSIKQALVRDKRSEYLYLISPAQSKSKAAIAPKQMRELIKKLRKDFDYVVTDCPAGIERGFRNAIAGADRALIVTTPEVFSVRDADRVAGLLETAGIKKRELIVNRLRADMICSGDMMRPEEISELLAVPLIGAVPEDEGILIATNKGELFISSTQPAGRAYANICRRLLGEEVDFLKMKAGRRAKRQRRRRMRRQRRAAAEE